MSQQAPSPQALWRGQVPGAASAEVRARQDSSGGAFYDAHLILNF